VKLRVSIVWAEAEADSNRTKNVEKQIWLRMRPSPLLILRD
jgi:hypothetical protein